MHSNVGLTLVNQKQSVDWSLPYYYKLKIRVYIIILHTFLLILDWYLPEYKMFIRFWPNGQKSIRRLEITVPLIIIIQMRSVVLAALRDFCLKGKNTYYHVVVLCRRRWYCNLACFSFWVRFFFLHQDKKKKWTGIPIISFM